MPPSANTKRMYERPVLERPPGRTAGVARAFIHAGARGVVASLWPVADWAAADAMSALYRGMTASGYTPQRTLREAKLALRRGTRAAAPGDLVGRGIAGTRPAGSRPGGGAEDPTHPFVWAPFVYQGLPR